MPEPLRGLVPIAECGSRFEADAVIGRLRDSAIQATVSSDPAMASAAPYMASDRTFDILVREEDADRALDVLADDLDDLPSEFREPWQPTTAGPRAAARSLVMSTIVVLFAIVMVALVVGFVGR